MTDCRRPARRPLAASNKAAGAASWAAKAWTLFWKPNTFRLAFSTMNQPKPAHFLSSADGFFRYVEKTNPHSSNLDFLTYGIYELGGLARSGLLAHPGEEALLFCW